MNQDEFIEILRKDFIANQQKYNSRNPLRKLWDKLDLKWRYWRIKDWFNQY